MLRQPALGRRGMKRFLIWTSVAIAAALIAAACGGSSTTSTGSGNTTANNGPAKPGGTMTVALAEDPDLLDPTLARTFVGRIVFANLCEKLYDVNDKLQIVPQLAASLPKFTNSGKTVTIDLRQGIKFNDGTTFDAQAVKTSLDRHRTLKASSRASETVERRLDRLRDQHPPVVELEALPGRPSTRRP